MKVSCKICNKKFKTFTSYLKQGAGKTCSMKCGNLLRSNTIKKMLKENPKYIENRKAFHDRTLGVKKNPLQGQRISITRNRLSKEGKLPSMKGTRNPAWLGGKSFEEYPREWTSILRGEIRERDNYTCKICEFTEEEHIVVYGEVLLVHHIDYVKKNCTKDNLLTVCRSCNARVNFNREYWTQYLGDLLCKHKI